MDELIKPIDSPEQINFCSARLREIALRKDLTPSVTVECFERWAQSMEGSELDGIPGVPFLRLWLRRGTLEPILERELGREAYHGGWREEGHARLRTFPVGTVGHWPAGNIEIQPALSMTCALLGGNGSLVRVPSGLVAPTQRLMQKLQSVDTEGNLMERIGLVSFDHSREDLQAAMARNVDGAMIWGGTDAVSRLRALPFAHWTRLAVFGPRLSVAAMDAAVWGQSVERASWCRRIARDVWQFEQQACSSPQVLFLERGSGCDPVEFVSDLRQAFAEENRVHPRREIHPALASSICLARAAWLMNGSGHQAWFPQAPDWTILLGSGADIPTPTQGRTLSVLVVDDLLDAISKFDGTVQTLGLAIGDRRKEESLALAAGGRGVDRIVKLGRMHVFGSPWDGVDLVRPMVRVVRYVPSQN